MSKPALVIDLETSDLTGKEIWCVGFASASCSWVVEWDEDTSPDYIEGILERHTAVFHNAKFDVRVLREHGVDIEPGSYFDTMVMSYVWNPRREMGHSLASWGRELGLLKLEEDGVHSAEGWVWNDDTKERIMRYCERDCEVTLKLFNHLLDKFKTDGKAMTLLLDVELPFIDCLIEMESTGFYIDVDGSHRMVSELEKGQEELMKKIHDIIPFVPGKTIEYKAGHYKEKIGETVEEYPEDEKYFKRYGKVKRRVTPIHHIHYNRCELDEFNPNSNRHIIYALFKLYDWEPEKFGGANNVSDKLWQWLYDVGVTGISKDTPENGQPKVDADTLEGLTYPLASLLTEYSVLTKMHGMVTGYLERLEGRRLFGNFNQVVTKTGRLSSSDPNLQNIPTNGEWGEKMRSLFCSPGDDWKMVGCDLSNIEGRVLAHYLALVCKEYRMAETFANGVDFHQANADAWGVSRKDAKTLLYAICYGAGPAKVGGGDVALGKKLMATVDANMPALKRLKEMVWETARKRGGLIHSGFGRRLYYPEINEDYAQREARRILHAQGIHTPEPREVIKLGRGLVAQAERRIFNALLQGTAADVLKKLVLEVWRNHQLEYGSWLIANVHDEALYYVPNEHAEDFRLVLDEVFRTPLLSHCEIKGDPKSGMSWHDIH